MAIVVDNARPSPAPVARATEEFTQPTADITYNNPFIIKQSAADGHIRTRRNSGSVNTPSHVSQSAYPIIDFNGFWHDVNTPSTTPSIISISITPAGPHFVGDTLTAAYSVYLGDPEATLAFQWLLNGTPIVGETSTTYLTVLADAGDAIRVRLTLDNGVVDPAIATSTQTLIVGAPSADSGPHDWSEGGGTGIQTYNAAQHVTVPGDASLATISWSLVDNAGGLATVSSSGVVSVNTNTSGVVTDDTVIVRATNELGTADVTLTLSVSEDVEAPTNTVLPTFTGSGKIGAVQNGTAGTWTGTPTPTLTYKTQRWNGSTWVDISGATSLNYTPVAADDEDDIRLLVTATNVSGSASAASTPALTVTFNTPVWGVIPAQEWTVDTGVQTLNLSPYLTVTGATITNVSVTVTLLDSGGDAFASGVFEDGVFAGGGSSVEVSVAYTSGAWRLSIDTDATGVLDDALVELRATNSGGTDDTSFTLDVVAGAPPGEFSLTLDGSDELVFVGTPLTLILNVSDELEVDYA